MIFGANYDSNAVIPDGTPPPAIDDPVTEYLPSARPGSRAPHVWLRRGNEQISTVDLIGPHFLLLAGAGGEAWRRAAQAAAPSWPPLAVRMSSATIPRSAIPTESGNWRTASTRTARCWFVPTAMSPGAAARAFRIRKPSLRAAFDRLLGRMPAMA